MGADPQGNPALFEQLQSTLKTDGPLQAIDQLCEVLRNTGDYHNLFYALLMRKRVELNVAPFPTGPSSDLPAETHEPYEQAIRDAARQVGNIYLEQKDLPRAWGFFRLIGETTPIQKALESYEPGPDEDIYPVLDIAWHQQIAPKKGFDLIIDRHGVCSAITTISSIDLSSMPELRAYCVQRLVKTLHEQLKERLRADLEARGHSIAVDANISEMIKGHEEIFGDDAYHIDVSHLSSVVQMALQLPPCDEILLAAELCDYGRHLSVHFRGDGDSPFEKNYEDYLIYMNILAGRETESGLKHFREKAEAELQEGNTYPAEVYVNLLLRLDRVDEALTCAQTFFRDLADDRGLSCPSVMELARKHQQFSLLVKLCEARGDAVNYLAGLIASQPGV